MARALEELPGIKRTLVSFPEKKAVVTYDPASIAIEEMCQALLKYGYVATPRTSDKTTFTIIPDDSRDKTSHQTNDLICYCFGYTRDGIQQDFVNNGKSLTMEKIAAEKKAGRCDCGIKNPKGK